LNVGGWLLLTGLFGLLMLVIQRAELKRRMITGLFMLIAGVLVWRFALYRMGGDCVLDWSVLCNLRVLQQYHGAVAILTVNRALLTALTLNLLFWALLGRYNPVGSSDEIKVIGRYDEV